MRIQPSRAVAALGLSLLVAFARVHAQSTPVPGPRPVVLQRAAEGFSLAVPTGWVEKTGGEGAVTIVQQSLSDVMTMVFVQQEPTPSLVTDVLAKVQVKLKNDERYRFVSSRFDVVADRPALIAVFENADARFKLTLIPRDTEDRSQVYYGLMAGAPPALFAKSESAFDRIVAGFKILPAMDPSQPKAATAAPVPAPSAPPRAPAAPAIDRAKVLERILAPRSAKPPQ